MSDSFRDFLRREAAKWDAQARENQEVIDEWRASVSRLFSQLRSWLADSDPDGIIKTQEKQEEVTEPDLGRYSVPRLDLRIFGKWIGIIPKARKTVASAHPPQRAAAERAIGRVDITDELRRYVLYRFTRQGGGDEWLIDDLRSGPKPLTQEAFESALTSYIR